MISILISVLLSVGGAQVEAPAAKSAPKSRSAKSRAQPRIELPKKVQEQQKALEDATNARVENKFQGELMLRLRKYNQKDFNAATPLLEMIWERERTEGDWKTTISLGGRYFKIDDHEVEPLAYVGALVNNWSFKLGFQTISWGQSFAIFSADLVNPKDLRDPLNTDPAWINIPVMMLNTEYFFDGGGLQVFVTPLPRNNKYSSPGKESDFLKSQGSALQFTKPDDFPKDSGTEDFEYGAKANYIFRNGLELSLFGLHHWNREALYLSTVESGVPKLKPRRYQLQSYGLGFSLDLNDKLEGLVARGDYVVHLNDQRSNSTGTDVLRGTTYDFVTGADWTGNDGWAVGAQIISHDNESHNESLGTIRATKKLLEDKLEVSVMYLSGFNTVEQWFQPKVTWIPISALEISLMVDFVDADNKNDPWNSLAPLKMEDRTQFQLRYLF